MGKKLYRQETSGEIHTLNPHGHYVTLPTSTIDLWMPLIGAVGVGVYALYCRLAREGRVRGSDLKRLAKAARISDNTLRSLNQTLERIGFIKVEKPEGERRIRHYATEIRLLEPPTSVPAELIRELECQSGYEILAHWLVESPESHPAAHTPPSGSGAQRDETTTTLPQGMEGTHLGGLPQARTIPLLPQPHPQGDTRLEGSPQASLQRKIPPLPQPRPQGAGDIGLGGSPQTRSQTRIPPLPQPRPQAAGDPGLGGPPRSSPQRTIPPLPQPRPQGIGESGLGGLPAILGNPLTSASSPRSVPSGGPVALSSVIESVWQRQIALMNVPHSAAQRELTLNSAPGSVSQRVMEAPTSATLESLGIESLRGREESPLPLFRKNLKCSEPPRLPWKDSQKGKESVSPSNQLTGGQVFTPLHNGQGEHG